MRYYLITVLVLIFCINGVAFDKVPERRRPQKSVLSNRYYFVPWFVHIEGIGILPGVVGGIANIEDSGTNGGIISFQNDKFHIRAFAIDDFFLYGNYESWGSFTVSAGITDIDLLELDCYGVGSDSDSTPFQVDGTMQHQAVQLQMRLFKDRFKISQEFIHSKNSIRLADNYGSTQESENSHNRQKIEVDLTDDRYDSRIGLRMILIKSSQDKDGNFFGSNDSYEKYNIYSRELSAFIPIYESPGQIHTLALNYYLSTTENLNDLVPLNRRNGNDLGGAVRMRGYPSLRFVDNNTLYYAVEYRWTFLGKFGTGGDDFILSNDTLEGLQLTFFHEWGQVSEFQNDDLYRDMKINYGVGFRAIWDSSLVMRLDFGFSDEGSGLTFLIMQPF